MKKQNNRDPLRLEAARERVTPLQPHLSLLRNGRYTAVLSDVGFGAAFADGRRLYGSVDCRADEADGVRVWLAFGGCRLYVTAMPDYARAEQDFTQGRRCCRIGDGRAEYTVYDDTFRLQMIVEAEGGGERRQLRLENIGTQTRTVSVCAAVTPAFAGTTVRYPGGTAIRGERACLALWTESRGDNCLLTGGNRLRMRRRLTLPPHAVWNGTFYLTGGDAPTEGNCPVRLSDPRLPPEGEQLADRLFPYRATAAFIRAVEEAEPSSAPPNTPFFHLTVSHEHRLTLLKAALVRFDRWTREGIPTGLWIICPAPLQATAKRLCHLHPAVCCTMTEAELPLWRALSRGDACRRGHRMHIALPYVPLPLTALPGESLRRGRPSPPFWGVCPDSRHSVLRVGDRLFSLSEARTDRAYLLPALRGSLQITVRQSMTEHGCRICVTLQNLTKEPTEAALTIYAEPQLHTAQDRALTLSRWEPESGTLVLTHPLTPRRLWLSGGAGASYDCDPFAFRTGRWGGRTDCPLPCPAAAVTRTAVLLPDRCQTLTTAAGWDDSDDRTFV